MMNINTEKMVLGQKRLNQILAGYYVRAGNLTVPMKRFGVHMTQSSIPETFRKGGRPTPWKPAIRVAAKGSGKTLIGRTRRLSKTWTFRAQPDRVTIGTNVMYARVHQYGATITAKRAKFLTFHIPGVGWMRKKQIVIPARPFAKFQPRDIRMAKLMVGSWIKRRA